MHNTHHPATARTKSELQLIAGLARIAQEALAVADAPGAPPTVSQALALILERVEVMAGE